MSKEKVLIVGLGEVGRTLFELLKESRQFTVFGLDTDSARMCEVGQSQGELPFEVNVMHICLLCNEQTGFISTVTGYAKQFSPKLFTKIASAITGALAELQAMRSSSAQSC